MRRSVILAAMAAVSATIGCAHNRASETGQGAEQLASTPDALIQMRRGGCPPGVCPVYSVSIFLDGTVAYDGEANVAVLGHRTGKVPAARLNDLLAQIEAMDFLDSAEQCCVCPDATEKAHLVILDYRPGAAAKTVLHDDACGLAPPAMSAIERSIDDAAGVQRWTMPLVASQIE
ncbi:MAG TPA: DUF6438 domain-containing protein [Polyangia bacterium]|jgi:hypothetical protein|nr:DUF6438 domain-containing protein [Polyangia bacterium]